MRKARLVSGGALFVMSAMAGNQALAQASDAGAAQPANQVAEVVITANRRTENLQKAPLAVTALTGAQLASKGLQTSAELQQATPGLTFSDNANFSEPYIRGVGTDITTPGANSSVSTYVDGVYQASPYFGIQSLTEVTRVEVLKGPQGTLYGRNATGGAINIITKDPASTFNAEGILTVGDYGTVQATAYVSLPITPMVAANLVVSEDRTSGYGKSLNTGRDTYALDRQYVRGKILFTPTANLSVLLTGQFVNQYDTQSVYTYFTKFGARPLAPQIGGHITVDSWDIYSAYPFKDFNRDEQFSGKITYKLGDITLTSLTAYTHLDGHIFPDFVSTDIPIFDFEARDDIDRTWTEDLTATEQVGRLTWIVGFSYLDDSAAFTPDFTYSGTARNASIYATVDTRSIAGFGEVTFKISDLFSVIGGVRYTSDQTTQARLDFGDGAGTVQLSIPPSSKTFDDATYKAVLQYTPNWGVAYLKYETGYKAGGVNALAPGDFVNPEQLTSYEVGVKSEWFDRRLRLNGAAFYYDYANLQSQYTDVASGAAYYETAKKATIYGAELEAEAAVNRDLTLNAGLNLLHTRFDDFISHGSYEIINGVPTPVANVDLSGNQLTHSPSVTVNAGVDWRLPLGERANVTASLQYYYSSKYYFDATNREYQTPYSTLNGRLTWNLPNGRTSIGVWVRNLTDQKYIASAAVSPFGDYGELAPPRTFGVTISHKID